MSREWMGFYKEILSCMYIDEYSDDMYCKRDFFGDDEEAEEKADQLKERYEAFLEKHKIEHVEGRLRVVLAVKYIREVGEKVQKELKMHPSANGFINGPFGREIINQYNRRFRLLFDDEDVHFAEDVLRTMFDILNPDYDSENYGIVRLFEKDEMIELYSRYADSFQEEFKQAIMKAGNIDYSYIYERDMEFDEYRKNAEKARNQIEAIVDELKKTVKKTSKGIITAPFGCIVQS